jgi:hypothetical protein
VDHLVSSWKRYLRRNDKRSKVGRYGLGFDSFVLRCGAGEGGGECFAEGGVSAAIPFGSSGTSADDILETDGARVDVDARSNSATARSTGRSRSAG